jgi:hypothetical protein
MSPAEELVPVGLSMPQAAEEEEEVVLVLVLEQRRRLADRCSRRSS